MSVSEGAVQGKGRRQLVLLVVLFLVPPIGAWVAWKVMGEQGVAVTTNAGQLISPARPLAFSNLRDPDGATVDVSTLRGRWTFVMFDDGSCSTERCDEQLYLTRQTRLAMNKDVERVQRLLVLDGTPSPALRRRLDDQHPDLRWVVLGTDAEALLHSFAGNGFDASGRSFFLVDPLGNLMMAYDLGVPAKGLMKDLQKLLKVSQIG
ncbi:MAG: hypothetical protein PVF93_00025 [Chromatiaceae bacterium]|jgi:hypothetical protein